MDFLDIDLREAAWGNGDPPPNPASLPAGEHSLFDAAWFYTADTADARSLRGLHTRSLVANPSVDEVLTIEEVEYLLQMEDWLGQVLVSRLCSGDVVATWRPEGEIAWRGLAPAEWRGAKIAIRKNIAEINSVILQNVLVSQAASPTPRCSLSRAKPAQTAVSAWVLAAMQDAFDKGRPPPKRDFELMPRCVSEIGATEVQVKEAFKSVPESLRRGKGHRDR